MRSVWCLVLPVFLGCSGQNVVAGQAQTKAEALEESLPSWCAQVCRRIEACSASRPCDCTGGSCSCVETDEDCTDNCQKELGGYIRQGDACAALGEAYKTCIDGSSCDDFYSSDANGCVPTASERVVCPNNDDDDPPQSVPTGSGGSLSTAGSAMIDHGTAGSAYGGATSMGGSITMGGSAPIPDETGPLGYFSCPESSSLSSAPGEVDNVVCNEARSKCPDGHSYNWVCAGTSESVSCYCFKDGELHLPRSFEPEADGCPSVERVNAVCGFFLAE